MKKKKINLYQIELKNTCFDVNSERFEIFDNVILFYIDDIKVCILDFSDVYRITRFTDDDFVYDFVNALYYSDDEIVLMNLN